MSQNKIKILHVTSSLEIGGAEKLLFNLLNEYQINSNNIFEHHVAYLKKGPYLKRIASLGITTHQIKKYPWDPFGFYYLNKIIQTLNPACIHATMWSANFASRALYWWHKTPVICTVHSHTNSGNKNKNNFIKMLLDKLTNSLASKVVVVSSELLKTYKSQFPKFNPAKIITINNGVAIPANKTSQNTLFTIGHVGRFVSIKNQQLLIHALALLKKNLPKFKATIIGYGELKDSLIKLTYKLNLEGHVEFIYTTDPEKHYPSFNCFVLPSIQEGQPMALLEAMAQGNIPIITYRDSCGVVEHLSNGIISPANNKTTLAKNILKIATNTNLQKKLSQGAKEHIKRNFSITHSANKYLTLYCEVISI